MDKDVDDVEKSIEEIDEIDKEIINLKNKKKMLKDKEKKKDNGRVRAKSDTNGKANSLIRVGNNFAKKMDFINDKREEKGFDKLSKPKITELIIKHKSHWRKMEQDIINFNTNIDSIQNGEDFKNE